MVCAVFRDDLLTGAGAGEYHRYLVGLDQLLHEPRDLRLLQQGAQKVGFTAAMDIGVWMLKYKVIHAHVSLKTNPARYSHLPTRIDVGTVILVCLLPICIQLVQIIVQYE